MPIKHFPSESGYSINMIKHGKIIFTVHYSNVLHRLTFASAWQVMHTFAHKHKMCTASFMCNRDKLYKIYKEYIFDEILKILIISCIIFFLELFGKFCIHFYKIK